MDAFDRFQRVFDKLDEISAKLRETHRYQRDTALLVIWLWGLGLPLVFLGSVLYAARHALR